MEYIDGVLRNPPGVKAVVGSLGGDRLREKFKIRF